MQRIDRFTVGGIRVIGMYTVSSDALAACSQHQARVAIQSVLCETSAASKHDQQTTSAAQPFFHVALRYSEDINSAKVELLGAEGDAKRVQIGIAPVSIQEFQARLFY